MVVIMLFLCSRSAEYESGLCVSFGKFGGKDCEVLGKRERRKGSHALLLWRFNGGRV